MNILIFSTFHLPPHFLGLNLEFIQKNLDEGHTVYLIDCNGSFSECGFNPYKLKYMCEICKLRENRGLEFLKGEINRASLKDIIENPDRELADEFLKNIKVLKKNHNYFDFNIGEAVYSSFISKTREREFRLNSEQAVLKNLAFNSILIYESVKRFIRNKNIEKIMFFNGRWEYYSAAWAAARFNDIEVEVFEIYRTGGYIETYGDNLPHNIKNRYKLNEECWLKNDNIVEKLRIADNFFESKKKGLAVNDKSYTQNQKKGKLPLGYDKSKKSFVLFNSSDDEFAAAGDDFNNPFFEDQLHGILYLIDYFKNCTEDQLIIRMHPNLKGLVRDYLNPIYAIENKYNNIILIKPEDDIDTYELMDVADTVISFGSTAGLEASYWGKPVILLGKCFYFYTDVAYKPKDIKDIPNLLKSDLIPKDRINAQKFGYYLVRGGTKAKYYLNEPNGDIYFKDHLLNKLPIWFKIYYKALKYFNIKN